MAFIIINALPPSGLEFPTMLLLKSSDLSGLAKSISFNIRTTTNRLGGVIKSSYFVGMRESSDEGFRGSKVNPDGFFREPVSVNEITIFTGSASFENSKWMTLQDGMGAHFLTRETKPAMT